MVACPDHLPVAERPDLPEAVFDRGPAALAAPPLVKSGNGRVARIDELLRLVAPSLKCANPVTEELPDPLGAVARGWTRNQQISTFSCDIAYSESPAATKASSRV
jgi:hypothetical protein